jgi:hypothetical protein
VQASSGLAVGASTDGRRPGVLPCQLLDHGTGYLAAAAALDGLRRQSMQGGTHARYLSLARTASWLAETPPAALPAPAGPDTATAQPSWLVEMAAAGGPATLVAPPGRIGGRPLHWPSTLTTYGGDPANWPDSDEAGQSG